jgi:hypothetical protein
LVLGGGVGVMGAVLASSSCGAFLDTGQPRRPWRRSWPAVHAG